MVEKSLKRGFFGFPMTGQFHNEIKRMASPILLGLELAIDPPPGGFCTP